MTSNTPTDGNDSDELASSIAVDHPALDEATNSMRLVYLVLDYAEEPIPLSEIQTRTKMPTSTAKDALRDLREEGLVTAQTDPDVSTRRLYEST